MENESKRITDYKLIEKDDLIKIVEKYNLHNQKPLSSESEEIKKKILDKKCEEIIIDAFCGVGESSYKIAKMYPDKLVVAFDKSLHRLMKKNKFKKENVNNLLIFNADVCDFYQIIYELKKRKQINIFKQFIFYPNPWPKKKNAKKRVYLNNVIPYVFAQESEIEVRSNWGRFLVEFSMIAQCFGYDYCFEQIIGNEFMTPFERKYYLSNQNLNKLILSPL